MQLLVGNISFMVGDVLSNLVDVCCQYYRVVNSSLQFISAITQVVVVQGGDLIKWDKASIGYYVGIDIADGSVSEINNVDL